MESTHALEDGTIQLDPKTGTAFKLNKGQRLTVIDVEGVQVADLLAFSQADSREVISGGRTLDYASRLFLTTGDPIYSNRSNIMLNIVEDTCKRHVGSDHPCGIASYLHRHHTGLPPDSVLQGHFSDHLWGQGSGARMFRKSRKCVEEVWYRRGSDRKVVYSIVRAFRELTNNSQQPSIVL